MSRKLLIGLGGGIGSGKTAASDQFAELGICIIDADIASRTVVEKGRPALSIIAEHFGPDILTTSGELNRAKLREVIFKTPAEKQWLEELLHPLIREEIESGIDNAKSDYAVLVSPLLVESGQAEQVDRILIIDAPEAIQVERTTQRDDNSPDQVKAIMANQADRQVRLAAADDIICNDGTLEELRDKVTAQHEQYLKLAREFNA